MVKGYVFEGLQWEPLFTISAICPNVMQGQNPEIRPRHLSNKQKELGS